MISNILNRLNESNSRNHKIEVLRKTMNADFKIFLELVFDKVTYKYNITNLSLSYDKQGTKRINVSDLKTALEPLYTRKITGNSALTYIQNLINTLDEESQYVIKCVLDRDLHCGVNLKTVETVYKDIVFKLPYMRCSLIDQIKNINYPAILQVKADGTYRTFIKTGDVIQAFSRSGEEYYHPKINQELQKLLDGAYIGELIVDGLEGSNSNIRYTSNGLLNSLNPPADVTFFVWDYLTNEEFIQGKSTRTYNERFSDVLKYCQSECIKPIESIEVSSYEEAREIVNNWISNGKEGGVLKDLNSPFKNGTSKYQIKMKLEIEIDVKCVGFTEGKGKFSSTFGAIVFESSDGKLVGQCSGINEDERTNISTERELYIGKILTIKGNGITKAKNSETYGVMHPQFLGFRNDKEVADDIERILSSLKKF